MSSHFVKHRKYFQPDHTRSALYTHLYDISKLDQTNDSTQDDDITVIQDFTTTASPPLPKHSFCDLLRSTHFA